MIGREHPVVRDRTSGIGLSSGSSPEKSAVGVLQSVARGALTRRLS
jgi:hypothetical protein